MNLPHTQPTSLPSQVLFAKNIKTCTAVASELRAKRVEVGSLSHYSQGFWMFPRCSMYSISIDPLGQVKKWPHEQGEMAALVNIPPCRGSHMENVLLVFNLYNPWLGLISLGGGSGIAGVGPLDFHVSYLYYQVPSTKWLEDVAARNHQVQSLCSSWALYQPPQLLLLRKKTHSDQIHLRKIPITRLEGS